MPELPEVETIRIQLAPQLLNKVIVASNLRLPRLLLGARPAFFKKALRGKKITGIRRRGKYLILELESSSLIFHLGMTGQLTYIPGSAVLTKQFVKTLTGLQVSSGPHPADAHTHFSLGFSNGDKLFFRDVRTFGKILYLYDKHWASTPRIKKLGPEPMTLVPQEFIKSFYPHPSGRPIKSLLLDQSFVCGLGNIYCDEALFGAAIHPESPVSALTRPAWSKLLRSIQTSLRQGIQNAGTTFRDYRRPDNSTGNNQEKLTVYGRGGQPCRRCGGVLEKITVAQRGTVFCSRCQTLFS